MKTIWPLQAVPNFQAILEDVGVNFLLASGYVQATGPIDSAWEGKEGTGAPRKEGGLRQGLHIYRNFLRSVERNLWAQSLGLRVGGH